MTLIDGIDESVVAGIKSEAAEESQHQSRKIDAGARNSTNVDVKGRSTATTTTMGTTEEQQQQQQQQQGHSPQDEEYEEEEDVPLLKCERDALLEEAEGRREPTLAAVFQEIFAGSDKATSSKVTKTKHILNLNRFYNIVSYLIH